MRWYGCIQFTSIPFLMKITEKNPAFCIILTFFQILSKAADVSVNE